jgi:uncharacterized protein DUF2190
MAKNVISDFGTPKQGKCKNIASAKLSGDLIVFPPTAGTGLSVALLSKDAASGEADVPCFLGNVVVRYTALTTDVAEVGTAVYFVVASNRIEVTAGTNNYAGKLSKAKANGETVCEFYLNER